MAQGYERKDNRPKMCFKVIGPRIIIWRILLLTFVLQSSFAIFNAPFSDGIHSLPFFLAFVFSCFCFYFCLLVLFLCLHIFAFSRMSSILFFWAPELDCLWSWKDFSCTCLQCGRWSLVKVNERNYQAQKGNN